MSDSYIQTGKGKMSIKNPESDTQTLENMNLQLGPDGKGIMGFPSRPVLWLRRMVHHILMLGRNKNKSEA